jgi:hypothetical protein
MPRRDVHQRFTEGVPRNTPSYIGTVKMIYARTLSSDGGDDHVGTARGWQLDLTSEASRNRSKHAT